MTTTIDTDKLLQDLAIAQNNLKGWEKVVSDLKAQLTAVVDDGTLPLDDNKIIYSGYQFIRTQRKTWTYPATIKTMEAALKQQQQISQLDGTATSTLAYSWTLKPASTT